MKFKFLLLVSAFVSLFLFENCKHQPVDDNVNPDPIDTTGNNNNHNSDTCSPDTVYFVNEILPLIQSNCAQSGCHDAASHKEGVILTDYNKIISTGKVKAGNPGGSDLYEVITETDPDKVMPPPPASLTTEQKNAIRIWIQQGAKNNKCTNGCDTTSVTFTGDVWPIVNATCTGCHNNTSASGGVKITNYAEIKSLVDSKTLQNVLSRQGPKSPMPPGGPLETCASNKIRIWINAGAPNN
ncbi:MAG: hypothetical protein H6607_07860 [Flavobacteriales bacterium]|nr:hypothetical protein [Flavobacteriales bacterium]